MALGHPWQQPDERRAVGRLDVQRPAALAATDVAAFWRLLPRVAARSGIRLYEASPTDESLESVFSYLVAR